MISALLGTAEKDYSVTVVGTAAEALALASKHDYDLYILDLWLATMDGMSICRRLRDRGVAEPIMFFSAMVKPPDKKFVMAAGADAYLTKPNDIGIFLETVERLITDYRSGELYRDTIGDAIDSESPLAS